MKKLLKAVSLFFTIALIAIASMTVMAACGPQTKPELTGIMIQYPADTLDYVVGDKFDPTGMVVVAVYSDNTTEIITDYTIDKTTELTAEDHEVTISYGGFSVKQAITCIPANEKVILDFTALGSRARVGCYADMVAILTFGDLDRAAALETGTWSYVDGVLKIVFPETQWNESEILPELNLQGGYQFDRNVVLMNGAYNMGGKTFVIDADAWEPVLKGKTWQ